MTGPIALDAHAIGSGLGGNERYVRGLVAGFRELGHDHRIDLYIHQNESHAPEESLWSGKLIGLPSRNRYRRLLVDLPLSLVRTGASLLHVQYVPPPVCPVPFVTTIHDLSFEHHPELFTRFEAEMFRRFIRNAAHRAARILTVSEYSKRDLVDTYHVAPEKVTVTYNGISSLFSPASTDRIHDVKAKYGIASPYVLCVGNLQPRKNLERMALAFLELKRRGASADHKLVIVGKKAWLYEDILEVLGSSRFGDDLILTDYVPDEDLPPLYSGADVFVYPSLFEGFGLPPLEAMACGTPTIVGDNTSLPEVTGDGALKVDARDVGDIAGALEEVLRNESLSLRLQASGRAQAVRFTWRACAERTWAAYEAVLTGEGAR